MDLIQAEELAKALAQMKQVLQGTHGMYPSRFSSVPEGDLSC